MKSIILTLIVFILHFNSYNQIDSNWVKQIGGFSFDIGLYNTFDKNGFIYTTGTFQDTVDFDPSSNVYNLISKGADDIFILKLDTLGNFIWAKQMGGTDFDYSVSITLDSSGNIYTTGYFTGIADFDPNQNIFNLTSSGSSDIFISKLDFNGNFIWAKQMGGEFRDFGNSLVVDSDENVYTTGHFKGTADFDTGSNIFNLISNGFEDIYISKLDAAGNLIWVKQIGGDLHDHSSLISLDSKGNIYTTAVFQGTVDFDPSLNFYNLTSNGLYDIFISRFDTSGNFIWAKQIGGASDDAVNSLVIDFKGNIYTTGYFTGISDFDPSLSSQYLTSSGDKDVFILNLDSLGNFTWVKQLGGTSEDIGYSVVIDVNGNIYTAGYFKDTADFDPSSNKYQLTSNGSFDFFISKLDTLGNFVRAVGIGSPSFDVAYSIVLDTNNNIYSTGCFSETVDFDPCFEEDNCTSKGMYDIYISKIENLCLLDLKKISDSDTNVSLFPNPATDVINIKLKSEINNLFAEIYNISGLLIYSIETTNINKEILISIKDLQPGTYYIKVNGETKIFVKI